LTPGDWGHASKASYGDQHGGGSLVASASDGEGQMIVSVFVRRLKEGATFAQFEAEWAAEEGYGIPTRVFNSQSLLDPREVLSIGFVSATADEFMQWVAEDQSHDAERHGRIETVIESTTLQAVYDVRSEHDFTTQPLAIAAVDPASLLAPLLAARAALEAEATGSTPGVGE
jgi:hypothetical protein